MVGYRERVCGGPGLATRTLGLCMGYFGVHLRKWHRLDSQSGRQLPRASGAPPRNRSSPCPPRAAAEREQDGACLRRALWQLNSRQTGRPGESSRHHKKGVVRKRWFQNDAEPGAGHGGATRGLWCQSAGVSLPVLAEGLGRALLDSVSSSVK